MDDCTEQWIITGYLTISDNIDVNFNWIVWKQIKIEPTQKSWIVLMTTHKQKFSEFLSFYHQQLLKNKPYKWLSCIFHIKTL